MTRYASTREAAARQLPWDAMGGALTTKAKTVAAALKEAGLDYTVERRTAGAGGLIQADATLLGGDPKRSRLAAPDWQALVRPMPDGTDKVLGFTKKRYTPIQNVAGFAVADTLVQEFGAKISGAADFRNGDRSLLTVDLADPIHLDRPDGKVDVVDLHLVMTNDHAGNAALTFALTPIRLACTNALPAAVAEAERVWKISHTPNAQGRIDLAAEAIQRAVEYRGAFAAQAQAMMDQPMVDAEFQKMVAKLYPVKRDDEGVKAERRREIHSTLMDMWHSSPTLKGIQGTRWAGYNVVTEYLDHMRPVRSEQTKVALAEGALDGPYVRTKAGLWSRFAVA